MEKDKRCQFHVSEMVTNCALFRIYIYLGSYLDRSGSNIPPGVRTLAISMRLFLVWPCGAPPMPQTAAIPGIPNYPLIQNFSTGTAVVAKRKAL